MRKYSGESEGMQLDGCGEMILSEEDGQTVEQDNRCLAPWISMSDCCKLVVVLGFEVLRFSLRIRCYSFCNLFYSDFFESCSGVRHDLLPKNS